MEYEYANLYTNNHELNYDEALRRISYWTKEAENGRTSAFSPLRILILLLRERERPLYFEPKISVEKA
jgi:hypothetical protein